MIDNKELFSGRAKEYASSRPAYSELLMVELYEKIGFSKDSIIADIGSGTGKFAKQMLERESFVICVEPNDEMRAIAQQELASYSNVEFVKGADKDTKLKDKSVDFITVAQAFHWFDVEKFRIESKRILKPTGKVVLIWNTRNMDCELNKESYKIYSKYCPRFKGFSAGTLEDDKRIEQFFKGNYNKLKFDNPIVFDREKFISRSLSSSYSIQNGEKYFEEYIKELNCLFDKYSKDGKLIMPNQSIAYIGEIYDKGVYLYV